jgi:thiol-disulfide isomerase/thioredoxin
MLVLLLVFALLLCSGEEINSTNFGQLREGCWLLRFYAPWCNACKMSAREWDEAKEEKVLRFGCRFAEINVDQNMALSESFGIRSIPSYFVVSRDGACRFLGSMQFSAVNFVHFFQDCQRDASVWESGLMRDPLSLLWFSLVHVGYFVESLHARMTAAGLNKNQVITVCISVVCVLRCLIFCRSKSQLQWWQV